MRKAVFATAMACLLLACISMSVHAVPQYRCVDLGALLPAGTQIRYGMAMNDMGQIVCNTDKGIYLHSPESGCQLVPTDGFYEVEAQSINNLGQVLGTYWGFGTYAFLYTPGSGVLDIGSPDGYGECRPIGINDSGQIVAGYTGWGTFGEDTFLFTPGQGFSQITIPDTIGFGAAGLNNLGQVVGTAGTQFSQFAWVYTPGIGAAPIDMLDQNWTPTGDAINDKGQVAGVRVCDQSPSETIYLYTQGEGVKDLGNPGGISCTVVGINESGCIIGDCWSASNSRIAWIHTPSDGFVNLNDLVLGPALATRPFAINDDGWIVGTMTYPDTSVRAFLLIPGVTNVPATVSIQPGTLNTKGKAQHITCRIELLSDERTVQDVVPESLRLQGSLPPAGAPVYGDADGNSVPDMTIQFSRPALLKSLQLGVQTVQLTGSLTDGCEITGEATVRVLGR